MAKKKINQNDESVAFDKTSLKKLLIQLFNSNSLKAFNYKQLATRLAITDESTKKLIIIICYELLEEELVEEIYTGKFIHRSSAGSYVFGVADYSTSGSVYVKSEDGNQVIFISPEHTGHALHGDDVKVFLFARNRKLKLEGEIVEIVKRNRNRFVGTIEVNRSFGFLMPDNKYMPYDIFIPITAINGAENKQKVVVEIVEWPEHAKNPFGKVVDVLGNAGENNTEMHAILAEFDLPYKFPEGLEDQAFKISGEISESEIAKRRDFRKVTTFTIDPEDAKDFDDALSMKLLENGNWEIGVHIADVSHYVIPDSDIDKEAEKRGTSVYLVDRVVPMLPEHLSNFLCSLRPDEEKLTYSAVFEMDKDANVLNQWFGKTIIKSCRRFSYEEAQLVIETGEGDLSTEILQFDKLAKILRQRRIVDGSIDFDRFEVKFNIDENGKPLGVFFKRAKDSNKLIEEFMLLANRKVAESIGIIKPGKSKKTFVYRVHDNPDPVKVSFLSSFIKRWGYSLKMNSEKELAISLNQLLDNVEGKTEQNVIEQLAIRSMAKAKYDTENIGHYGLSFKHYTHFTSPIRRYPDLMVHRLLTRYLDNQKTVMEDVYSKKCKHASDMENVAALAERASKKYKQVEFMQDKVGQVFEGTISGVTQWGMFVELNENKIEGLIALRNIEDDYYVFDEQNYCIVGSRSHRKFQLGDAVKVQIMKANLLKKQLDFAFVKADGETSARFKPERPFQAKYGKPKKTDKKSKASKPAKNVKTKTKTKSKKKKEKF